MITNIFLVGIRVKDGMYDKLVARIKQHSDIIPLKGGVTQDDRRAGLYPVICKGETRRVIEGFEEVKLIGWKEYGEETETPNEWTTRNFVQSI